jgi:2-methylcitrate dehydratase PrpD
VTMGSTEAVVDFALKPSINVDGQALVFTLVDTIGVSLAGNTSQVVQRLREWSERHPMPGPAHVWGTHAQCDASRAALLNGTAAHALDFDDASPSMPMHASAVIWPALMAVAEERGSSLADVFEAAAVGQTLFRALAEALPMSVHYPRGWHSTATIGRLAGALAIARLVGLSHTQSAHAVGIAASMAAGSIANFGTMTKPIHAGQAAQDAVLAVQYAEVGLTANASQLDHPKGFFALFGDPAWDRSNLVTRLGYWEVEWTNDVSLKRYPSCYGTHRAIDAMINIREHLADHGDIDGIEITVHERGLEPLIEHFPTTELEAKFNLAYTVGLAACQGSVGLADFGDGWVCPSDVSRLMDVTEIRTAAFPPGAPDVTGEPFSHVVVRTSSGETFAELVRHTRGGALNPMTPSELFEKTMSCGTYGGFRRESVKALGDIIMALYPDGELADFQRALKEVAM